MNLFETVKIFAQQYIDNKNDWYNWKEIKEEKLPLGIKLPIGNQYLKNLELKRELNKKWKENSSLDEKYELIKYYIESWGGIHTNSKESMMNYTTLSATDLIKKGKKGIASWSKAIVLHDPERYAIFDARVSISLNCIQKIYDTENKTLFPILPSRNKVVLYGNKMIKREAKSSNWEKAIESEFYTEYLNILKEVATKLDTNISTIEMLLFAKAEVLVEKALIKIKEPTFA
jgi:hypothetical protein